MPNWPETRKAGAIKVEFRRNHLHMLTMADTRKPPVIELSPTGLVKALLGLRGAAVLVFPFTVFVAALWQRGPLLLVFLVIGMMFAGEIERRRLVRATRSGPPGFPAGLLQGFALRLGALAGLFIMCVGLFALFRDTQMHRGLGWPDALLFLMATAAAIAANEFSARLASTHVEEAVASIRAATGQFRPGPADADGEVIDGEVVDPQADKPQANGTN
jgi:hypothetical protein